MVIWDYFMRRKWLLLTVLAVFLLSGMVSGYFLQRSDTYVVDSTVLNQPEKIEDANSDTVARVQVPILSEEQASVAVDSAGSTEMASEVADAEVELASTALEAPQEKPADADIDVPLTSQSSQADINEAWRTLFATWQQATWSIFGVITIAIVVVLFVRWTLWRKIR